MTNETKSKGANMKILAYMLGVLLLLAVCAIGFVFSSFGNDMIASYAQKAALEKGVKLEFTKFKLGLTSVDISAKINGEITANISGGLSIFTQNLDLIYNITASDLKSANLNLRQPIDLSGQIKGKFSDFDANGAGKALGSNINFIANLKDQNPTTIELNAKNLDINEALVLLAKPAYASGKVDIVANVKEQNGKPKGTAEILIYDGVANEALIAKDFNVTLPKNFTFKGATTADIDGLTVTAKSLFVSSVATVSANKTIYDISKKTLESDFNVNIDDLAKFESIVGQKLNGAVNLNGNVKAINTKLSELNIGGTALGGNLSAKLKDEKLNANLKNGMLKDLFSLVGQKPLANANIDISANLSSLDTKNLNGDASVKLSGGEIYEKAMSQILGKDFPVGTKFELNSDIKIAQSVANFTGELASSLADLKNIKGNFDMSSGAANVKFDASVPDLKKLAFVTGRQLHGALNANVTAAKQGENLTAEITSQNLMNGKFDAKLKNNDLNAVLQNFTFKGLSQMLGIDHVYDGVGDGKLDYDIASQQGKFNIDINEGRLVASNFTNTIKTLSGRDITTEIYKNGVINGTIDKNMINFAAKMSAQRSDINVTKGTYNTANSAINIPIDFRYEKTDAKIDVTGTAGAPKYSVSSNYLKGKVEKEIGRFLDKKLGGDSNSTNSTKDAVKGLLKNLF